MLTVELQGILKLPFHDSRADHEESLIQDAITNCLERGGAQYFELQLSSQAASAGH